MYIFILLKSNVSQIINHNWLYLKQYLNVQVDCNFTPHISPGSTSHACLGAVPGEKNMQNVSSDCFINNRGV